MTNQIDEEKADGEVTLVTELCFWSHPPGIPHEAIMAHLERIAKQIMPAIKNVAAASADA
jgi:hypothetical protein